TFASAPGSPFKVESPPFNDAATPINLPIVAGDFNHSGHLGLAVGDQTNAAAYILLGKGDGTFSPSSAAFASSHDMDIGEAAGDFNGDGNLDLALREHGCAGLRRWRVLLGRHSVRLGYPEWSGRGRF